MSSEHAILNPHTAAPSSGLPSAIQQHLLHLRLRIQDRRNRSLKIKLEMFARPAMA